MAFEKLGEKLQMSLRRLTGRAKLNEKDIEEMMKEIRLSLLDADVNFKVVKAFTKSVKEKALGEKILKGLNPDKQVFKIVQEELTNIMGSKKSEFNLSGKLPIVMLCGLQGAGKTTHAGKLAYHFIKHHNLKPLIIAADVYRPAAIEQLLQLGEKHHIDIFEQGKCNPREIVKNGINFAEENNYNIVIIDTAGRLSIDEELMNELVDLNDIAKPNEVLLTIDSMTGQDAVNVAQNFNDKLPLTGTILTKLDGDTRGGAALSVKAITNVPIKFVGVGENIQQLEEFYPDRMASRILGMGDMQTLVEKAMDNIDEDDSLKLIEKIQQGKYNFNDYIKQLKMIKRMGSFSGLLKLIPGVSSLMKNVNLDDAQEHLKQTEIIISSMTKEERKTPSLIDNYKRKQRIAKGSGNKIKDVEKLIDSFAKQKQMFKSMLGAQNVNLNNQKNMPTNLSNMPLDMNNLPDINDLMKMNLSGNSPQMRKKGKGKNKGGFRF